MSATSPKIFLIDIETSPNISYTWGKYEQDVLSFMKEWELLSFAFKELGRGKVRCYARPMFKNEKELVRAVWGILDSSDILIGHNIDGFDSPKLRAKFVEFGLGPPRPYKTIDTLKIARAQFSFNSNKLNDLAKTLHLGEKVHTGGVALWLGCMAGDVGCWAKMMSYNKHDVVLLEAVYLKLRAWFPNHPNLALYEDRPACPVCCSDQVQRRGYRVLNATKKPRYQCQTCGHWFASVKLAKMEAAGG